MHLLFDKEEEQKKEENKKDRMISKMEEILFHTFTFGCF